MISSGWLRRAGVATFAGFGLAGAPAEAETFVYVSCAIDGEIQTYAMDPSSGALQPMGKVAAGKVVMPMAFAPDKKHLYAAIRSEPYRVLTYAIDPKAGTLKQVAEAPLPDSMPTIYTDRTGRFLFTASYGGDKIAVNPIDPSGRVTEPAHQVISTGRNDHTIQTDRTNRFAFASNLGSDQLLQFRFDAATGRLTPNDPPAFKTRPDHGPRHLVFSPDNRFLYVLHELSGHVAQLALDNDKGTLSEVASVPSVPAESGLEPGVPQAPITAAMMASGPQNAAPSEKPRIWAADVQMTPDGRFLFTTERTSSKIALFSLAPGSGTPTYVTNVATETQPRGIKIDPAGRFLVATGEKSDRVAVYRIAHETGHLAEIGRYPVGQGANWVEIIDLP